MCRLIFVSLLAILSAYVHFSEACNGYKMRLISVDNCSDGEHVLEVDKNFTSKLSEDCFVTNHGCITSKGFSTAKVKYSVKKNGIEMMSGHTDACSMLDKKNADQKAKLEMLGLPTECPVPEGRKCYDGNKKVDISKFKNLLAMVVGKMVLHSEIDHDTGKSCIETKFEIFK